jgi:hypothetical protein
MGVDNRSLFKTLLRSCLTLDLYTPSGRRSEILSDESISMLKLWTRFWSISEACQIVAYLAILFHKFQLDKVPVSEVLKSFHFLYANMKVKGWFPSSEVLSAETSPKHCFRC